MERHLNSNARRTATAWLRRTHGWIGLWGGVLGLLFGFSGIWLNHRALLQLQPAAERSNIRLELESPPPATTRDMTTWIQHSLGLLDPDAKVRVEKARAAPWAEASASAVVMQPEHWVIAFNTPQSQIQADYWVGNQAVSVRRTDAGVIATLANLHKGVGMPVAWILLVDTLAGSMILLSLSGLALWMLTRRKRALGLAIAASALAATAGLAIAHL
jgi:uncharacterized protein